MEQVILSTNTVRTAHHSFLGSHQHSCTSPRTWVVARHTQTHAPCCMRSSHAAVCGSPRAAAVVTRACGAVAGSGSARSWMRLFESELRANARRPRKKTLLVDELVVWAWVRRVVGCDTGLSPTCWLLLGCWVLGKAVWLADYA